MKQILIFIITLLTFTVSIGQIETRATQDPFGLKKITKDPGQAKDINLWDSSINPYGYAPTVKIPIDKLWRSTRKPDGTLERILDVSQISEELTQGEPVYIHFYPENMTYIIFGADFVSQGALNVSPELLTLDDVDMAVAVASVKRVMNGQIVEERRWISEYILKAYFPSGNEMQLGFGSTPVRIIANYDKHVNPPSIVPGSRHVLYSDVDNPNFGLNRGGQYSPDGGLMLDYDAVNN